MHRVFCEYFPLFKIGNLPDLSWKRVLTTKSFNQENENVYFNGEKGDQENRTRTDEVVLYFLQPGTVGQLGKNSQGIEF